MIENKRTPLHQRFSIALSLCTFGLVSSVFIVRQVPEMSPFDVYYVAGLILYLLIVGIGLLFVKWSVTQRLIALSVPIAIINVLLLLYLSL